VQQRPSASPIKTAPAARAAAGNTVVIIIVSILALVVLVALIYRWRVASIMNNFDDGRYRAAIMQVRSLDMKIQAYVLDVGSVPASLNDLVSAPAANKKWAGPYAKLSDLTDPFGHAFVYKSPGDHGDYDIVFLGKDGRAGGKGIDADYGNWESAGK
jgi:general secretion pathway protein G